MKAKFVFKGGTGSGNFGHSGRPGKVGGSGSGDYKFVGYHGTNNKDSILRDGFNIGKAGSGSGYGGLLGVGV